MYFNSFLNPTKYQGHKWKVKVTWVFYVFFVYVVLHVWLLMDSI